MFKRAAVAVRKGWYAMSLAALSVAAFIVVGGAIVCTSEIVADDEDYVHAVAAAATKPLFDLESEVMKFYVFDRVAEDLHHPVVVNNVLRCDFGEGFEFVSSKVSTEHDFEGTLPHDSEGDELLREVLFLKRTMPKVHLGTELRAFAREHGFRARAHSGQKEPETSTCVGVHTLSTRTRFFRIDKASTAFTGPFEVQNVGDELTVGMAEFIGVPMGN